MSAGDATRHALGSGVLLVSVAVFAAFGAGNASTASAAVDAKKLPTKSVEVGGVTVDATPKRLDERGARIAVVLDTHEVDLDANLRRESVLSVGGTKWPTIQYSGDGPGGHHREGVLTFEAAGPPRGVVKLTIGGLDRPARLRWRLGDS